jgi:succinate dehydrogenase/fumarate reductase flavoprotein subunit
MSQQDYDVIIIGAGIAGLVTANRAAQLGKRVVVLEKGTEEKYLCNSRYAYGTIHINYSDLGQDEDVLMAKIDAATEGVARKDLARAVAKDGRRLVQWLKSENVDVVKLDGYQTAVLAPAWREGFGLTWKDYGSDIALQRLGANFEKRQGRILRGTRARGLKLVPGGVDVDTEGSGKLRAAFVVIADGGFQANLDMVRAFGISPAPEKLLQRNGGTAVGDGIKLAQSLGAAITESGMNNIYGHIHSRDAMRTDRLWPRPYMDEVAASGIVIDTSGRRVADEGLGGIWLTNAIARSADPLGATIIFDQPIWDGPGRNHVQPPNPLMQEAGGTLHRSDTLGELAALAGVPPKTLEETVAAYNAALDAGALQGLSPPRSAKNKPWPIRTPPYYALPICVAITNCMGGIVVDGDARVLDKNDKPIPGLFAAGSTVGGLDGGPHAGYVGGLIKATIGLRAAETIAGKA